MSEDDTLSLTLEALLKRYRAPDGKVNYLALTGDSTIVSYAESLANFDIDSLETREQKLAFWINSYNALSIYGVVIKLKKDPKFIEYGHGGWFTRVRFFALQKFKVGGKEFTLRKIENFIREEFQDPRIHFALNCATRGCPLLKDGHYSAENIDAELDAAAKLYLGSKEGLVLDMDKKILYLSMIFKWYKKDFNATGTTLVEYVLPYISDDKSEFLEANKTTIKIKFLEYNWDLNVSEKGE